MRENKSLMELGQKSRAGRVLSEYLRAISVEKTETIINPITCKTEIVSKGEAIARQIWDKAFGRHTRLTDDGRLEVIETGIDIDWVKLLLERIEGRVGIDQNASESHKPTAAEKVSEINRRRLNKIASGSDE